MRALFSLVVLLLLAGVAYYYWRYRPAEVQGARQALDSVGDKLQATKAAASVKTALELDRELKQYPVDVDAGDQEGVVVLRGEVPSEEARMAVERRASSVPDVQRVVNEVRVNPGLAVPGSSGRTLGENFDDQALEAKVRLAFSLNRDLKGTQIDVRSYRRQVTLSGQVNTPDQHQLAIDIARRTPDVASVTDQIGVAGQAAPTTSPATAPAPTPTPRVGALDHGQQARNVLTS